MHQSKTKREESLSVLPFLFYAGLRNQSNKSLKKRELQIYPNPANHAVEVVLPGTSIEAATFTLRDVTGRTVLQTKASVLAGQPNKINLQQLSKGLYLLHVQQGNSSYTAKVVKQ